MNEPRKQPDPTRLLARALGPTAPELTCEQCFELLDQYVDLEREALAMMKRE